MNIPIWLTIFMSIMYATWTIIEIDGFNQYAQLQQSGISVKYTPLSKLFTILWLIVSVAILCYLIFG